MPLPCCSVLAMLGLEKACSFTTCPAPKKNNLYNLYMHKMHKIALNTARTSLGRLLKNAENKVVLTFSWRMPCIAKTRRGENRASVLRVFFKNVVFAIAKPLINAPKLAQNSPGFWRIFFNGNLYITGNLFLKTRRVFFPTHIAHCYTVFQGSTCSVTSRRLFVSFRLGVHPTPLPHPDASHQLWVDMAVGSRPLDLVEREHGMADLDSRHIASTTDSCPTPPTQWRNVRCACDAS